MLRMIAVTLAEEHSLESVVDLDERKVVGEQDAPYGSKYTLKERENFRCGECGKEFIQQQSRDAHKSVHS